MGAGYAQLTFDFSDERLVADAVARRLADRG